MATQDYIPVQTRLVVRDGKGEVRWYVTRKEIVLTGDPMYAECPVTGQQVRTVTEQGIQVYFLDSQARVRDKAAEQHVKTIKPMVLMYDIPSRSEASNPSGRLRRLGVRVNYSCWVLPAASVPYALLDQLAALGVRWHCFPYDTSAAHVLVDQVIGSLRRELEDTVARAQDSQDAFVAECEEAGNTNAARKKLRQKADAIKERVDRLVAELTEGAKALGVTPAAFNAARAGTAATTLRTAMHARASLYAEAGKAAAGTGTQAGAAVGAAVAADAIPAGVVADFLDDHGQDSAALRDAFTDPE